MSHTATPWETRWKRLVLRLSLPALAIPAAASIDLFQPLILQPGAQPQAVVFPSVAYPVKVRIEALQNLQAGQDVRLPFSAIESWEGAIQRVEKRDSGSFSLFGKIAAPQEGWFIFTVEGNAVVASIQIPTMNLLADLRNIDGDSYWLCLFESSKAHQFKCGVTTQAGNEERLVGEGRPGLAKKLQEPLPQHDLMVLYTQGLVDDFPRHYRNVPIHTAIQHFVDFSNQAYINSGVQLRLRLAYEGLVDANFSEALRSREWLLDNLTGKTDGYLDHVHTWRTTYHADLVCLMYSFDTQATGGGGGLAHLLGAGTFNTGNPANWYGYGFSVVEGLWEPSIVEPPVSGMVPTEFAHEIGHNQGLHHNCTDAGAPTDQVTTYAYGWRFAGNSGRKFVTIMSYLNGDYATATPLPNFSNPSVLVDGQPTGNASTAGCSGTTGARNAQALNLTANFMSRLHLRPLDPWVDFNYVGAQNGRFEAPWMTLNAALNDLPATNPYNTPEPPTITFKGAANSGPLSITINKRVRLTADGGPVTIGGL